MSAQPNDGKPPPNRDLTINSTSEDDQLVVEMLVKLSKGEKVHQCKNCGKIFPSGQALGGHQRKYYKGPLKKNKNKVVVDTINIDLEPKVAVITNNGIDLNMPPPPDNFEIGEASNSKEEVEEGEIRDLLITNSGIDLNKLPPPVN